MKLEWVTNEGALALLLMILVFLKSKLPINIFLMCIKTWWHPPPRVKFETKPDSSALLHRVS